MKNYEQLLENIYENLPEKVNISERFENPKFDFFTEGNKTIIRNFNTVCDKLRREKNMLIKYLSKELAVPVEAQGERAVVQRKLTSDIINKKLDEFVIKFVICKECKKPDTHIQDRGHSLKQLICEACGARNAIR